MNNKVTIKDKNGNYLQHVIFNDINIQNDWIAMLATNKPFGEESEYSVEIVDVTAELAEQARIADLKAKGAAARIACQTALDLIAGHNIENAFTSEQITQMVITFAPIQQALMLNRPSLAKTLISAITPDGVIITEQLKTDILADLAGY